MSTPTTRRHPRSLSDAFPDVRAHCIEGPARYDVTRAGHRAVLAVSIVGAIAVVGALLIGWLR